ncbi:MAG: hypothetical protein E7256_00625 [Lachnospiraceae bacterium]|nr:hypothetical protein [Lachnospiraceae bacterium]
MGNQKKGLDVNEKKTLLISCIIAVVMIAFVVLMVVESTSKGKLTITNETDKEITSVKMYFANYDEEYESDALFDDALAANTDASITLEKYALKGMEAGLIIEVTFDGEEKRTFDVGYFNNDFEGKIKVSFYEEADGSVSMKVKATTGLFGSTSQTYCNNDVYELHLGEEIE